MIIVPPLMYEILRRAQEFVSLEDIARELGRQPESLMRYVEEARAKGLIQVEKRTVERYELTEEGRRRAVEGLPELKLLRSAL
jgi:phenylalanyl-tRNA synthetase alpha chain